MKPTSNPGLYLHLPFCSAICPYCDFYVLTGDRSRHRQFLRHLSTEIELCADEPWPDFVSDPPTLPFDTIYLGGGTPSLLDPIELATLLDSLRHTLPVAEASWIGLEANPEDVTEARLAAWQELGVRFLSLGVQSFDPANLAFLDRHHDAATSLRSVAAARVAGFETLSIDLIYGLPGQTDDQWRRELDTAVRQAPDHLSCYQLTIEPRTPFGFRAQRGELVELAAERQADLFLLTHQQLADAGFHAYEVSNFATAESHRSRHNCKYWQHVPYLGLGPSAHSFAAGKRWWNLRKIRPWQERLATRARPIEAFEALDPTQLLLERLMLGLRTAAGVTFDDESDRLGAWTWQANQTLLAQLVEAGLVEVHGRTIRPTTAGLALAESLARRFELPPAPSANPVRIC